MIRILVKRAHAYTVQYYLDTWGRDLRGLVRPMYYEEVAFGGRLKPGAYIFADLERLDDSYLAFAKQIWALLSTRPDSFRALNNPSKALRRYDLLRTLHTAGINQFVAHRVNNGAMPKKFPLFLRRESEHNGAISPLLQSSQELESAIAQAVREGQNINDLLAVEFCDTSDAAGLFRKFSAFRVGDRVMPRHLLHSRDWVIKLADDVSDDCVREEQQFIQTDPHEQEIRRIFELANVDYGRIDYAIKDGKVQVWEINTNPTITVPPMKIAAGRLPAQVVFIQKLKKAFETIDMPREGEPIRLNVAPSLARKLNVTPIRRMQRVASRGVRWLARQPFVTDFS